VNFEFVAGHIVLDFVGTVAERDTSRTERLVTCADLADWLVDGGILDTRPRVRVKELDDARRLREALYALVRYLTGGAAPTSADRDILNRHAAVDHVKLQLGQDLRVTRSGDAGAAIGHIAREGLALAEAHVENMIRWCAAPDCTRPFLDRSHGNRRRWCGMSTCGDKAKAAAYRARQAQRSTPTE
jgi:predicted RNA-binding Zn ribbon-like protein